MSQHVSPDHPIPTWSDRGRILLTVASSILCVLSAACGGPEDAAHGSAENPAPATASGPALEVQDVHIQLLADNGSAYFTVVNSGNEDDRLLRVETPVAGTAETHETVDEDGVLRMLARPEGFAVPAGGQLSLAPGGKHIMLLDLTPVAEDGTEPPATLTLYFERSGSLQAQAHVMRPAAGSGEDSGHQHDH